VYAPRKGQAFASKRLQKVVSDFRAGKSKGGSATPDTPIQESLSDSESDAYERPGKRKRRKTQRASTSRSKRGGRGGHTARNRDSNFVSISDEDEPSVAIGEPLGVRLRPRPKQV
jgi:DNA excision repair protein ERCC-5